MVWEIESDYIHCMVLVVLGPKKYDIKHINEVWHMNFWCHAFYMQRSKLLSALSQAKPAKVKFSTINHNHTLHLSAFACQPSSIEWKFWWFRIISVLLWIQSVALNFTFLFLGLKLSWWKQQSFWHAPIASMYTKYAHELTEILHFEINKILSPKKNHTKRIHKSCWCLFSWCRIQESNDNQQRTHTRTYA